MTLISRGSVPWLPDGIVGRCDACKELVQTREWGFDVPEAHRHACFPCGLSYSLQTIVNPDNTPWVPGYTFYAEQCSGARRADNWRARMGRMTPRTYKVVFEIDMDGVLRHVRGPKPTDETMAAFEAQYARERPGSNWYPGAEDGDDG